MLKSTCLKILFASLLLTGLNAVSAQRKGLSVLVIDKPYFNNVIASYEGFDKAGNTSIANDGDNQYKWSKGSPYKAEPYGYFNNEGQEIPYIKRDRDLGQTFAYAGIGSKRLTAITVSTGYGTNAIRANMYGKHISLQVFEVKGKPRIYNNGSDSSMKAFHGFPHNRYTENIPHTRDDYYIGEEYKTIAVLTGATFPSKKEFGFNDDNIAISSDHPSLKGKLIRFGLPANSTIVLQPAKVYAFLIMIDTTCANCGFTLANNYSGSYNEGHAIRRDGNGTFPPFPANPGKDFTDPENAKALASAHFPKDFSKRIKIARGSNGYPVDTWRDLWFIIEAQ